jgi:plasmid stability protein
MNELLIRDLNENLMERLQILANRQGLTLEQEAKKI